MICIPPHLRLEILGGRAESSLESESAGDSKRDTHHPAKPIEQPLLWGTSSVYLTEKQIELPLYVDTRKWDEKRFREGQERNENVQATMNRKRRFVKWSRVDRLIRSIIIFVTTLCVLAQLASLFTPRPLQDLFHKNDSVPPLPSSYFEHCTSLLTPSPHTYTDRTDSLLSSLPEKTVWISEPGPSSSYFLGSFSSSQWHLSERPFLIVIHQEGVTLLTPAFEALRASLVSLPDEVKDRTKFVQWREDQSPYDILKGSVGEVEFVLDGQVRELVGSGLRKVLRENKDVDVKAKIGLIRERKDEREIGLLKCANQFTLHAIRKTRSRMFLGITESKTSEILEEEMAATGLIGGEGLVLFGENAALPHGSGTDRVLNKKDLVLIDAGGKWGGYVSDITRTFALPGSKIPANHIELWETVRRAQYAPFELLTRTNANSSIHFGELDKVAREVITSKYGSSSDSQSGPNFSIFTHRLGHGIGLEGHEAPYLVQGPLGEKEVKEGHVFSLEPGTYLPSSGQEVNGLRGVGVRLEDCFVVIEREGKLGGEWLSGPVEKWGDI